MRSRLILGLTTLTSIGLTAAPVMAQTVILTENFDAFPTCSTTCGAACVLASGWTNVATDNADWTTDAAGTPSSPTGPSVDHTLGNTTGRYLYIESSSPCFGYTAELLSPVFDVSTTTYPAAQFWYHMYGQSQGTLHVDLIRDPNNTAIRTNDVIPPITDNLDAWQLSPIIPLDPAAGTFQIVIRGITGTDFYSDMAIDDFSIVDLPAVELQVANAAITGGCAGAASVQATLTNNGGAPATGFNVQYVVNGGAPVNETFSGSLASGASATYNFATPVNLAAGTATVTVTVTATGDANVANDSDTTVQTVKPVIANYPYQESFEAGNGGWTTYGGNNPWQLGTPADDVINSAYDGTNAWVTNLTGDYPVSSQGFIDGPCFDASTLSNPRFEAYLWHEAEFSYDGAQVQISTDGITWTTVGVTGDPTWYNDATIVGLAFTGSQEGWTGRVNSSNGSGGWIAVGHDLGPAAAVSTLRVRIAFGSDTSVQDDGVAIDAIRIVNNPPRVEVSEQSVANAGAFPAGSTNVRLQALGLESFVSPANVTGLTLTKQGTLPDADIIGVTLMLDDGDGLPGPADTVIGGPQTFTAGAASFTFGAPLTLTPGAPALVWVMADLGPNAAGGLTFGTSLNAAGDLATAGAQVTLPGGPAAGPLAITYSIQNLLPFADAFDVGPVANRQAVGGPGVFPTATGPGTAITPSAATTNPGFVIVTDLLQVTTPGGPLDITAPSAPSMALLGFPLGQATAALDWHFDLSSYTVLTDDVFLMLQWNNVNQIDHPEDHIFVSLDGGATWALSAHDLDFTTAVAPGWNGLVVDIGGALAAAGLSYSANMVVRLQVAGDATSAFMVDDAWFGSPAGLRIERLAGVPVLSGSNDDLGNVAAGVPQIVQYTLHNDGETPLVVDPTAVSVITQTNVSLLGGPTSVFTIPPGGTATADLTVQVVGAGAFQLSLGLPTNDPRLTGGLFALNVVGVGVVEPDINLTLADGTALPSGQGHLLADTPAGVTGSQNYVVVNAGGGALTIASAQISNSTNVTATLTTSPGPTVAGGASSPFTVEFTPTALGAFSYEITITSDDPDTATYVVSASATARAPDITVSRGGTDLPNGTPESLGMVQTGVAQQLTYTIGNAGDLQLTLSGNPLVAVQNANNVSAQVSTSPTATVAPGGSTTFVVDLTPTADGAFDFDLIIASDDPDEGTFALAVDGTAFTPAPEITVTRDGNDVANGATEEAGGSAPGVAQVWTYTISNPGTADLVLSGPVTLANNTNVEASISTQPSLTIAAGASTTFGLSYAATAPGAFSVDVQFSSNDADEGSYSFTVRGTGDALAPEIAVEQPEGTDRASGAIIALGEVTVGAAQTLTFTVKNTGAGPLTLSGNPRVAVGSESNATGEVTTQPDATVAAGASTTFTVSVKAAAAGAFSVGLSIANDDGNEGTFTLVVSGSGKASSVITPTPRDEGGCGCTAAHQGTETSPAWAALALGLLLVLRRRRR